MVLFIKNILIFSFLFQISPSASQNINTKIENDSALYNTHRFPQYGYDLYKKDRQKALQYFEKGATYYKNKKDTTKQIRALLGLSDLKKRQGNYNSSFEIIHNIQSKIVSRNDYYSLTNIHKRLGSLYGVFGKDSLALFHLNKGLSLSKRQHQENLTVPLYFTIAEQYIQMKSYDNAITHLDSCYLSSEKNNRLIYVDANYSLAFIRKNELHKAKIYLRGLNTRFEQGNKVFLAKIYAINAEYQQALEQTDSAIYYYKKSLHTINSSQVHMEIKPIVLKELAHLYNKKNNQSAAYKYMSLSKSTSDSLFHLQSKRNKELFEIKNKYQEDLLEKERQLNAQTKLLNLKEKSGLQLQLLIAILILLIVITFFTFRQRSKIKKMVFHREKNEAIIATRNKELTANALQFIAKERTVKELLKTIEDYDIKKYKALNNKYKKTNEKIWEDFHLRFTKTNDEFYKRLLSLHPKLTQNDLKQCALIKLNFDSKEMSQILGISLNSVHMARSRIRGKMNLPRDKSLGTYITSL